jgi:hypothetical protein
LQLMRRSLGLRHGGRMTRVLSTATLVALGLGCNGSEPSDDLSRCGTTGEFGNTGCAEVAGLVTDADGGPVSGAYMSVQGAADPARMISLVYRPVRSSSAGAYQLRAIRMGGEVPSSGPDTVTVWVRAVVPPPSGAPDGTAGVSDSVQATLELRPVGAAPVVVQAAPIAVPAPRPPPVGTARE